MDIRQWGRGVGLLVAALMVLGACGGPGGTVLPTPVKTKDPLAGDYVASGANGANPQMTALITRFSQLHPGVNFKLNDIDTETSIVNVNTGDVDFGYIGRDLRTTEPKINLTPIGFTAADIVVGCSAHRWLLLPIERPRLANLERWYGLLKSRPASRQVTSQLLS